MENLKFLLTIDGVFNIIGRVTVTGKVEKGQLKKGDKLDLIGGNDYVIETKCMQIEKYRKLVDVAQEGEWIGIVLLGVSHSEIRKGMQLIIEDIS